MVLLWVPVHGKSKMRWSHFSVQLASWASVAVCAAVVCLWRCPAAKRSRSVPSPYSRHFWARRNVAAWTPRRRISYGDCFLFSLCSSGINSSLVRRVISPKGHLSEKYRHRVRVSVRARPSRVRARLGLGLRLGLASYFGIFTGTFRTNDPSDKWPVTLAGTAKRSGTHGQQGQQGGPTKHRTGRETPVSDPVSEINCRDPVINLYTAYSRLYRTLLDESTPKFYRTKFIDDRWMTCWTKQRNTAQTDKFTQKQLVSTAPTRKLIYSLHAMPHTTKRHGVKPEEIYWRRTDDLLDKTTRKLCTDRQNSPETARCHHTDLKINLFTICHAITIRRISTEIQP